MSTLPTNRVVRSVNPNSAFAEIKGLLSSAININQGDLCWYDIATHLVKPTTGAAGDGAAILGISPVTIVSGVLKSPYSTATDASEKPSGVPGPVFGVEASMKLKSGDVFHPGDLVYTSAVDAATVSVTANGTAVGMFVGPQVTAGSASLGVCRIFNNYGLSQM